MQKLYCYVDETGQDTEGDFFLVSVVIAREERDVLRDILVKIETASGKHQRKWIKSHKERQMAYIQKVFEQPAFKGKLFYGIRLNTKKYVESTVEITSQAILATAENEYKATVFVDGLLRSEEKRFASGLRKTGIKTDKVRGLSDEADIFIRLADAICGFVRDALPEKSIFRALFKKAVKQGYLQEVQK